MPKYLLCYDSYKFTDPLPISCGVPQGSILGPLLFLIYVNDICNSSQLLTAVMFADDTNLFMCGKNIQDLFSSMNSELEKVSVWFKVNKLSLNVDKTKFSLFHSPRLRQKIPANLPILNIDNTAIQRQHVTKFLGVFIDENLSWQHHINIVNSKIAKNIGLLYTSRDFITKNQLKQLYFSFVHPYIVYANISWASTHKTKLISTFLLQKHCARIMNYKDKFTHAKPLLVDMNIQTVYEINVYQVLNFIFKCKERKAPFIFNDLYTPKPVNKYNTRSKNAIIENFHRSKIRDCCISFRGPYLWNRIVANSCLCGLKSFSLFRNKLKTHLYELDLSNFF